MKEQNKTCAVCGKTYTYCSGCGFQEPSYRRSVCSESCRDIYRTLSALNMNKITKEEAASKIRACDLTDLEHFKPNIKKEVQALLSSVPKKEAALTLIETEKKSTVSPNEAPQPKKLEANPVKKDNWHPAPNSNQSKQNPAFKNAVKAMGIESKK